MRSTMFQPMAPLIPEGKLGEAEVKHIKVSAREASFSGVRAVVNGRADEVVHEGSFAQLLVRGYLVMSDTYMEQRSNYGVVWNSKGDVLIAGLGLGMILLPILTNREVKTVTVIEQSQDVIDLIGPHVRKAVSAKAASKLTLICADIFEWKPPKGQKWDAIYFDIWADICTDNLKDMAKLHRKFARRKTSPAAWMNSWKKADLQYQNQRDKGRYWA